MGEKETTQESPSTASAGRTSVQDFEKNTEAALEGGAGAGGDAEMRAKALIRNTNSEAREHVMQHNESDLDFRRAGGDTGSGGGDEDLKRKDITVTIRNQQD